MSSRQSTAPSDRCAAPWRLIVPVKHRAEAKSRLKAPSEVSRPALAGAMARDTLEAAAGAVGWANVCVVTGDDLMASWATRHGMTVAGDPAAGLNAAVDAALKTLRGGRVAVLLGDLPALDVAQLRTALAACTEHPMALVPDWRDTGTCLLASTDRRLTPHFGRDSARRHEHLLPAHRLRLDLPGLRQDVDDAADLASAIELGVGRHTRQVLRGEGHAGGTLEPRAP
ncbi:2-phospho-L-lactate guanylyltransferase [soil metagenome]